MLWRIDTGMSCGGGTAATTMKIQEKNSICKFFLRLVYTIEVVLHDKKTLANFFMFIIGLGEGGVVTW